MNFSRYINALTIIVIGVGGAAGARGQSAPGPVIPDRPGYTDAPTVLPKHGVQLELGYTTDKIDAVRYQTFGESLLRLGVGGSTELRLFGNSLARRSITNGANVAGLEDPKLGLKTSLFTKPDSVHG